MENRFGFKDFVNIILLAGILVTMWWGVVQNDRHWEKFKEIQESVNAQTRDLTTLRRTISGLESTVEDLGSRLQGSVTVVPQDNGSQSGNSPTPTGNIFRRVREVNKLPDYAPGDVFVDNFSSAPPKLSFLTAHDVYSRQVYSRILEPLAGWDIEKVKMVPYLAKSWSWSEDNLELTVKLREDVTFSDGEPMDADDVIFTWKTLMNPEITDGHTRAYYRHGKNVEKIDQYTVRWTFEKVFYENFLRAMEVPVHPEHFFEGRSEQEIRNSTALVMGTGPYRLRDPEKYTPGEPIELVRNERYWGVPGPWDRMIFRVISKESTEQIAFQNGEIDLFVAYPDQHVKMLKDEALVARTQQLVYEHVRTGYLYIAWNQKLSGKPTVFADKRVRQAMTMLLDRERIVRESLLGFGTVASGPFHHLGPQHNSDVSPWPYDPGRAVELLKVVGFTVDADGVMYEPNGERFKVKLTYPAGSDFYQKIMLGAKDNYARAGIEIELDPQEWSLLLKNLKERSFDAITLGWGAGNIESDIEQMFHTRTIGDGGDNRNAYSNPELDALIDRAHVTMDYDERIEIWKRCHEILHEDQPYTFLFRRKVLLWLDKRVKNVKQIPVLGINYVSTWVVPLEWYVPKSQQKRR